jgi:hypothetical protein
MLGCHFFLTCRHLMMGPPFCFLFLALQAFYTFVIFSCCCCRKWQWDMTTTTTSKRRTKMLLWKLSHGSCIWISKNQQTFFPHNPMSILLLRFFSNQTERSTKKTKIHETNVLRLSFYGEACSSLT